MVNFPRHDIDPRLKDIDWGMQWCKAAWNEFSQFRVDAFYSARYRYDTLRDYALGNQNINQYKPQLEVAEDSDETWLNIDWKVLPIIPKFRDIALGRAREKEYDIVATPIDPMSQLEDNEFIKEQRKRIRIREIAKQDGVDLTGTAFESKIEEPDDLEEFDLYIKHTYKNQFAKEIELAAEAILDKNRYQEIRDEVREDLFDYGIGGFRTEARNGEIKVRRVRPGNLILSYCREKNFTDKMYIGEIRYMTLVDIAEQAGLSDKEMEEIAHKYQGLYGNPNKVPPRGRLNFTNDRWTVPVLDMEWYSWNTYVYEKNTTKYGNNVIRRTDYKKAKSKKENHLNQRIKVVYRAKWIVDTNYAFDFGMSPNMPRKRSNPSETTIGFHLYAYNFYEMRPAGLLERLIPLADAIQINWYKLQHTIATARPRGIQIELGGLEDVSLGKGGETMTPLEILDLYNKKGVLVYRRLDQQGRPTNYKPIEELENGIGRDAIIYFDNIQRNIQLMRDALGLNELTDGSTPKADLLTTPAQFAYESTNNALSGLTESDKNLMLRVAEDVVLRMQCIVSDPKVDLSGYVRMIGKESVEFFKLSNNVAAREYAIILRQRPTAIQRQELINFAKVLAANGAVDFEDLFLIQNTVNLRQAQDILVWRAKKRREEQQEESMRLQQMNGQIQIQSAQAAEQAKQQTIQIEKQWEERLLNIEKEWDMRIAQLKEGIRAEVDNRRTEQKTFETAADLAVKTQNTA